MKKKIFILVGASGSGKSWVANQIRNQYSYVPHDTHGLKGNKDYVMAISAVATASDKPVVCDTPYSLSQIQGPLVEKGYDVRPVFIIEKPSTTKQRYEERYQATKKGQSLMPKGHITIIETYKKRAEELNAPSGTSSEILDYMRNHADKEGPRVERPQPRPQHEAHDTERDNQRDTQTQAQEIQSTEPEAVRDVRPWAMGGHFWQKDLA